MKPKRLHTVLLYMQYSISLCLYGEQNIAVFALLSEIRGPGNKYAKIHVGMCLLSNLQEPKLNSYSTIDIVTD